MNNTENVDNLFGNSSVKTQLGHVLREGTLAPSYLFHGPHGVFIDEFLDAFAKDIIKGDLSDSRILNLNEDKYLVDVLDTINSFLLYGPSESSYRVVLIHNFDKMSVIAQNALLKSIEEPPEGFVFILGTTSLSEVLPTIKSRSFLVLLCSLTKKEFGTFLSHNNIDRNLAPYLYRTFQGTLSFHSVINKIDLIRRSIEFLIMNLKNPNVVALLIEPGNGLISLKTLVKTFGFEIIFKMFMAVLLDKLRSLSGMPIYYNIDRQSSIESINLTLVDVNKLIVKLYRGYDNLNLLHPDMWMEGILLNG